MTGLQKGKVTDMKTEQLLSLRHSWVQYMQMVRFYWFVTLTFKDHIPIELAKQRFFVWLRSMNEMLYGRRYREKKLGISFVLVYEYQKREVLHFHSLLGGDVHKLDIRHWKSVWENNIYQPGRKKLNGIARITEFDPEKSSGKYLTKDILEGDEIDYYFSHDDRRKLV